MDETPLVAFEGIDLEQANIFLGKTRRRRDLSATVTNQQSAPFGIQQVKPDIRVAEAESDQPLEPELTRIDNRKNPGLRLAAASLDKAAKHDGIGGGIGGAKGSSEDEWK